MRLSAFRAPALAATALVACLALAGCKSTTTASNSETSSPPAATASNSVDSSPAAATASKSETTSPAAANLPDPCSLLTVDQISAAVGATVQPGQLDKKVSQGGQLACVWTGTPFPFVQVLITPFGDQIASQRQSAQDAMGDVADVTIPGADGAYSFASGSTIGMAIKGYFVQVAYNDTKVSDYATPAQELAKDVAAAL